MSYSQPWTGASFNPELNDPKHGSKLCKKVFWEKAVKLKKNGAFFDQSKSSKNETDKQQDYCLFIYLNTCCYLKV